VSNNIREIATRTDARGIFRICGLPTATTFTAYAKSEVGEASPLRVPMSASQRFARADLLIDRPRVTTSSFTGVVVDSSGKPLANADVLITDLTMSASTGANGGFRIDSVAPGNHAVTVRRLGYGPMDVKLDFVAGTPTDARVVLTQITVLDTVVSEANKLLREAPLLREFEENRKIGLGKFLTRADLEKARGRSIVSLFDFPGFKILTLNGGQWVKSTRSTSINPQCYELEDATAPVPVGANCGCFPIVYLDFQRLGDGRRVANINRFKADELEAVEFYRSGAETPQRYAVLDSQCGVIILHTRRPK
jgi:hypothetical protein